MSAGLLAASGLLAAVGGAKYRVGNFTGLLIGAAVLQVAGAWWASEGLGPGRWLCIAMIAAGSLGLKLLE